MLDCVLWNMGCGPRPAKYRKTHAEAWRYLLDDLKPDVALVQEALLRHEAIPRQHGQVFWSEAKGVDSGTAVFVRAGLEARRVVLESDGSYVAAAEVDVYGWTVLIVSIHVGPPDYKSHLNTAADRLGAAVRGRRFVVGGDLNAARHWDHVYGGHWFQQFFEDLSTREFYDCHWQVHQKETQSFWGRQAKHPYQCDHVFVDARTSRAVGDCRIIDNPIVRTLSDHGPLHLHLNGL